ncbi:MAG TPA: hypothetical protein VLM40_02500 [Gemmata sp.]|nr:hypothetical protein [Gemmata sp.]
MTRLITLTLLAGILAFTNVTAQIVPSAVPGASPAAQPRPQRTEYMVKNADPKMLAEIVGKHYKGDADLLAVTSGGSNAILISGTPAAVPDVLKLLEKLDRKPRNVEVEVYLVEVPAPKDGKEVELTDVLSKLDALTKSGSGQRIKLTAMEGQPVTSTTGGNKPVTTSTTVAGGGFGGGGFGGRGGGGGPVQRSIMYQPVGTTVKLTARVGNEDVVSVDLDLKDSKIHQPAAGDEAAAPGFDSATLSTRFNIPAGKPVVAQTVRSGGNVAVVVVSAKVVEVSTGAKGH